MSGADFWRVGYGADFARHIERISLALSDLVEEAKGIRAALEAREDALVQQREPEHVRSEP